MLFQLLRADDVNLLQVVAPARLNVVIHAQIINARRLAIGGIASPLNLGEQISLLLQVVGQVAFAEPQLSAAESRAHGQKLAQSVLAELDHPTVRGRYADLQGAGRESHAPEIWSDASCYRAGHRAATRPERETFAPFDVDREFVLVKPPDL